jgi:p-aminobenzoyl-glutamate transporter AbgT
MEVLQSEVVLTLLLLVGWFVVMRFVLPRMGVST